MSNLACRRICEICGLSDFGCPCEKNLTHSLYTENRTMSKMIAFDSEAFDSVRHGVTTLAKAVKAPLAATREGMHEDNHVRNAQHSETRDATSPLGYFNRTGVSDRW